PTGGSRQGVERPPYASSISSPQAEQPVRQDTAAEVTLELTHDESGQTRAPIAALLHLGEKGLPMRAHGRVQERPLRLAASIRSGRRGVRRRRLGACPIPDRAHPTAA